MYGRGVTPVSASSASNGPSGDGASVQMPTVDSSSLLQMLFELLNFLLR